MRILEEKFQEKMKEYDHREDYQEENVLDEHRALGNFIQKKRKTYVDSFCVFKDLNREFVFKSQWQRINNLRQFQDDLPIYSKKKEFMDAYKESQVIIFKSNAGSGKSTQLPQYLMDCARGRILVTEPRVIAVENVARRVQYELKKVVDADPKVIGFVAGPKYDVDPEKSMVVYITETQFKEQLVEDKLDFLNCFEAFIVDEAHEMKKSSMLILAALKNFVKKSGGRHKIIVTSATLNSSLFEEYFSDLKLSIIECITPTYEVEVHYTNFPDLEMSIIENTASHLKIIFEHIRRNFQKSSMMPNMLIFLPSVKVIKEVKEFIKSDGDKSFEKINNEMHFVLEELHGALKPEEKQSVIKPNKDLKGSIRVILASRIAETAITIEDIYYVLDSGLEREYFFDEITKMNCIKETKISKSSADQRMGRAGRMANGYCFKMYKQEDEVKFSEDKIPEILRMDIADLILVQTELKDLFNFSDLMFYNELSTDRINSIRAELIRIGAIESNRDSCLTKKGQFMMRMNVGVMVSAFLYECHKTGVMDLGMIAASALENTKGFFKDNQYLKKIATNTKELDTLGDLAPLIEIHQVYRKMDAMKKREFHELYQISEREIAQLFSKNTEINDQIRSLTAYLGDVKDNHKSKQDNLQLAFMKTFPKNICMAADESLEYPFYMMIRDKMLMKVHGSSVINLLPKKPKWVCCQNLVLSTITDRPMTRMLVPIKSELLSTLYKADYKAAMRMEEEHLPQKVIELDVPTSLLRFFRAKNHNELIQRELKENLAYLETDEERETLIYFYIKDLKREQEKKKEIVAMKMRVNEYAQDMVKKRQYLIPVSDRTKMQVNELGQIVDVLSSLEYLSFVLKTMSPDFISEINKLAKK